MNVRVTETWKMFFKILLCKDDVFALEKKVLHAYDLLWLFNTTGICLQMNFFYHFK